MKTLRQMHTFIGCFFAPLLIYFCISGFWQTYRLHDHEKGTEPTKIQSLLTSLSNPHVDSTIPGKEADEARSSLFKFLTAAMVAGFVLSAMLGIKLACQNKKQRTPALVALVLGIVVPILFLFIY